MRYRPVPEPVGSLTLQDEPALVSPELPRRRIARRTLMTRLWIFAGGTIAAVTPAGFGLAQVIGGGPPALPLFAVATVAVIITAILNAAVVMYQARQETLRREIDRRSADRIAEALARYIDDAHGMAQGLPPGRRVEEAEQVRARTAQIMTASSTAILALLGQLPDHPYSAPPSEQKGPHCPSTQR